MLKENKNKTLREVVEELKKVGEDSITFSRKSDINLFIQYIEACEEEEWEKGCGYYCVIELVDTNGGVFTTSDICNLDTTIGAIYNDLICDLLI